MAVSTYTRDHRLARYRGAASPAVPASYHISLHSADPGLTGANELTGNAYARAAVSAAAGSWSAPATNGGVRQITNAAEVTFPAASPAAWAQATHFGVWDAATAGNFERGQLMTLADGTTAAPKTAGIGDVIRFVAGALILQES